MKTIKILGTGCAKCKRTEELVRKVIGDLGLDVQVEKVEDIQAIMAYNILSTPAVVVDEEVVIKGRIPSRQELEKLFADVHLA